MNTTTTTASTAPAAAGLAIASLAAELLVAGLAAVLIPLIALVLALAGYGHELVAERRRADATESSPEPVTAVQPLAAPTSPAPELRGARDASHRDVSAAVITARRIEQLATYQRLAAQQVTTLRTMAREAGHRQLARKGRRGQLLAALVPA